MGASLRTAFAALPACKAAMLVLGDLPELTENDLSCVGQAVDPEAQTEIWRGATEAGKPGHPIVFAASLFPEIAGLKGDAGGQAVVAGAAGRIALIPLPGNRARRDLDTPEDWAVWRAEHP